MKNAWKFVAMVAVLVIDSRADAGFKRGGTVGHSADMTQWWGSAGGARNSVDAIQYIGCMASWSAVTGPSVLCTARDAAGNLFLCQTNNSSVLAQIVSSASSDSFYVIQASGPNAGSCKSIEISNSSQYEPKK
jgi:hypothetical protein